MRMIDLEAKMENQEADMAQLKEELCQAHKESKKKFNEHAELLRHILHSLGISRSSEGSGSHKKIVNKTSRSPSPARVTKATLARLRRRKNAPSSSRRV